MSVVVVNKMKGLLKRRPAQNLATEVNEEVETPKLSYRRYIDYESESNRTSLDSEEWVLIGSHGRVIAGVVVTFDPDTEVHDRESTIAIIGTSPWMGKPVDMVEDGQYIMHLEEDDHSGIWAADPNSMRIGLMDLYKKYLVEDSHLAS